MENVVKCEFKSNIYFSKKVWRVADYNRQKRTDALRAGSYVPVLAIAAEAITLKTPYPCIPGSLLRFIQDSSDIIEMS